jgi:hypothetical protein
VLAQRTLRQTAITADVRLIDARTIYSQVGDLVVWLSLPHQRPDS